MKRNTANYGADILIRNVSQRIERVMKLLRKHHEQTEDVLLGLEEWVKGSKPRAQRRKGGLGRNIKRY